MPKTSLRPWGVIGILALSLVLSGSFAWPALGDRLARNVSAKSNAVMARPRPHYDPICMLPDFGLEDGPGPPWLLCPRMLVTVGAADNVFRTSSDEQADVFTRISPRVGLRSDWLNHQIELELRGEIGRFADNKTNDYEDVTARVGGRMDVTDNLQARLDVSAGRQHEDRGDPDSPPGIANVNVFNLYRERLTASYTPSDLYYSTALEARQYDWQDNGTIDNDVRDRHEYDGQLRVGYKITEETSAFVQPSFNARRYEQARDAAGLEQDSQGWDARVGFLYDVSGLTYLETTLGYFQQYYAEEQFDTTSGMVASLDLTWNVTDLATVTATADRTVRETASLGVSGIVRSSASLGLDYELGYDLIGRLRGDYALSDFRGSNRSDDTWQGRVALSYLVNEFFWIDASYRYDRRNSTLDAADYEASTVQITLRAQY